MVIVAFECRCLVYKLYKCMILCEICLHPQREVSLMCFCGHTCVLKDTVHFDSARIHHLLPQEMGRL
jgi:hypothetical protein